MKKYKILLFLSILCLTTYCQDSLLKKHTNIGIGISAQMMRTFAMTPYISYNWIQHKIAGGIIIGKRPIYTIETNDGISYRAENSLSNKQGIIGANIIYQFYPNSPGKIFDLYFENRLTYTMQQTVIASTHANINCFEDIISYGMRVKFLKRFSFYLSTGIGATYRIGKYSRYKKIPLYRPFSISAGIITGIEMHF